MAAVGRNVTGFRKGDEVFVVSLRGKDGCYAERLASKEESSDASLQAYRMSRPQRWLSPGWRP